MDFYNRYEYENYNSRENCCFEDEKFEGKNNNNANNKACCVKKVETYYCCPSYYTEGKKEECKEEKKDEKQPTFYEGTFKLYPSYCDCKKEDRHEYNEKDTCNRTEDIRHENNNRCSARRCCFCNLFRNCRRW